MKEKQKIKKVIEQLNIIDDTVFEKMAEDIGFCEETISTILERKVKVLKVISQNSIKNLQGRSVVLDALCEFTNGERCNVEVQKENDDDHQRRVRYNTSCITANITDPGTKFENVPTVYGIFISKFDIFKENKTVYHVDRIVRGSGTVLDNGLYEIYVNTKIDDGSDIAQLMKIYKEQNTYDFERFPNVSKRKKQFLKSEEVQGNMVDVVREYAKEYAKERELDTAKNLLKNGVSYEIIVKSMKNITPEELKVVLDECNKEIGLK